MLSVSEFNFMEQIEMAKFKITFYTNYPQQNPANLIIDEKTFETDETQEQLLAHLHVLTAEEINSEEVVKGLNKK